MCIGQAHVRPIVFVGQAYIQSSMCVEQACVHQNMWMGQVDVLSLYNSSYVFGLAPKQFYDGSLIKWSNKSHIGEKNNLWVEVNMS